jgi:predicted RND superfamily exporter protein
MIAGIALGIAVNDTLHILIHFQRERHAGASPAAAMGTTFDAVGPATLLTTLVAASGFLVLSLSDFMPLLFFGVLTSLTLLAALVGDLLLLPALLLLFAGPGKGE